MANMRGGGPEQLQFQPSLAAPPAQAATSAVPSLLEMMQGVGGGPPAEAFRDDTDLVAQNYQRALASQNAGAPDMRPRDDTGLVAHNMQLARASQGQNANSMLGLDDQGNIVDQSGGATDQRLGAPPAYSEGNILGGYNSIFGQGAPPSGWFTMADYYNQGGPKGAANPNTNSADAQRLSTNNWRLLPPQYQDPNYFQYNGQIISRRDAEAALRPKSVLGLEGGTGFPGYSPSAGSDAGRWRLGRNSTGWGADEGYIGSLGGWGYVGGEVT